MIEAGYVQVLYLLLWHCVVCVYC